MSKFKVGCRVRIDEGLTGKDEAPYTGIGVLEEVISERIGDQCSLWLVRLEWLCDHKGKRIGGPGETYSVFEDEISGVIHEG